jgi:hypothetical protein
MSTFGWIAVIVFSVVSSYLSYKNREWFRYQSRRLWAIEFVLDAGVLLLLPGWWKILGLLSIFPCVMGLYDPIEFAEIYRKTLRKKANKSLYRLLQWEYPDADADLMITITDVMGHSVTLNTRDKS